MNRKQKIIISVTGIFIVLLILVGLTYAYFLTRIQGNTNTKSISVTTANLELTYSDNSAEILGENLKLIPSDTEIGTKTFTVTNNGDDTSYVVVIENVSITKDGTTTTFESNDFKYTLSCTKKDGTSCDGVNTQSVFPINGGVLVGNSIKEGDVHTYTFNMWYIDTGIDQSNDMGKTIQARLNITDIRSMANPYSNNTNSLAYNIIENARNKENGTELLSSPKTKPAGETSLISTKGKHIAGPGDGFYGWDGLTFGDTEEEANEGINTVSGVDDVEKCKSVKGKHISSASYCNYDCSYIGKVEDCVTDGTPMLVGSPENTMSIAMDDYGTSYYYRGNVIDNYVNFAGMCWKIVRIEGDGSTKLILEDRSAECNSSSYTGNWSDGTYVVFGYDSNNKADFLNYSGGLADSLKSFQTTLETKVGTGKSLSDYLKIDDWCYDDTVASTNSYGYDNDYNTVYEQDKATNGWYTDEYYGSYKRINTDKRPSLKCTGTKLNKYRDNTNMYVGTLTVDEMSFAGATKSDMYNHYLTNSYVGSLYWWGLSPDYYGADFGNDVAFKLNGEGTLTYSDVNSPSYSRPALTLKSGIQIMAGNGTISNPYVVS